MQDVNNGGHKRGGWGKRQETLLSNKFFCNPKRALKNKVYKLFLK